MKRFIVICIILCIILYIILGYIIHIRTNSDVIIGVEEITISDITDDIHLDYWFETYNWSDSLKNHIEKNKSEYFWVTISYRIQNNSKKYTMNRVRFFPEFRDEMKEMLDEYTTENEIFTYVYPGQEGGFAQRLLVSKMGHSPEEIETLLKEQKIKVEYSGGKKYIFSIQEAIVSR